MRDWWGTWTRNERLTLAGIVVAILSIVVTILISLQINQYNIIVPPTNIGGHAALTSDGDTIDVHTEGKSTNPSKEIKQITSGDGSPVTNDTDGNVIINITPSNVE